MFHWFGRSKRARQILNDMYSSIQETQMKKAQRELEYFLSQSKTLHELENKQKELSRRG